MDHRFSALFLQAPRTPVATDDTTMSGALPDPGKRKSTAMKGLLRKLFGVPRQTADPLIKSKEEVLAQQGRTEKRSSIISLPSNWASTPSSTLKKSATSKNTKAQRVTTTNSAVVVQAPKVLPAFGKKDIFNKSPSAANTNKRNSTYSNTRDSKFSSISSLPSLAALSLHVNPHHTSPGPSISLSIEELALLQSLIRKISRQLKKQEYLTNHLAGNLVHLFERKEAQIQGMKRLRSHEREMAAREIWRVRETIGRGFLRRGVLVGRSEGSLNLLRLALDNATRAPSTPQTNTRRLSSSSPLSLSRTSTPSSYKTANSSSDSNADSHSDITTPRTSVSSSKDISPTFTLPLNALNDTTSTLTSDLSLHSILNSELHTQIYTACLASRWNGLPGGGINGNSKGNVSDRIMMHRFVSFVENRIKMIEEVDARLSVLVGAVEKIGKRG